MILDRRIQAPVAGVPNQVDLQTSNRMLTLLSVWHDTVGLSSRLNNGLRDMNLSSSFERAHRIPVQSA